MSDASPEEKTDALIEFIVSRRSDGDSLEDADSDEILERLHLKLGAKFAFPSPVPLERHGAKAEFESGIQKELKKIRPPQKKPIFDLIVFLLTFTFMTIGAVLLLPAPHDVIMGSVFLGILIFGIVRDKINNVRYIRHRPQ